MYIDLEGGWMRSCTTDKCKEKGKQTQNGTLVEKAIHKPNQEPRKETGN